MTARQQGTTAADVFELHLERHERQGLRRLRMTIWALASSAALGFFGMPSVGEYVVRRRDDGREVARVDAESEESTAQVRAHLERQLQTMTPEAFTAAWAAEEGTR